jgi:tetratricopeptide (TPR) repeat protein
MKTFLYSLFIILIISSTACTTGKVARKIIYSPTEFYTETTAKITLHNKTVSNEEEKILINISTPPFEIDDNITNYIYNCIGNAPSDKQKISKLKNCLQLSSGKIEYSQFTNYNAVKCFAAKKGNCFSITNLAIGMARKIGLNAYYILVENMIGNQNTGDYIIHTNHIVCGILLKNYISDGVGVSNNSYDLIRKDYMVLIDFIPNPRKYRYTVRLTDLEAAGLFYNNIASGKMIAGEYEKAKQYFEAALLLYPNSYQIHNNLGVLYLKLGFWERAEQHFEKALYYVRFPDLIMSNIVRHYERLNKPEKAKEVLKRLTNAKKRNPYYYLAESKKAMVNGNPEKALLNLKIAKKISKHMPEIYSMLSKVYKALGNERKSKNAWNKFTKMTVAKAKK